MTAVAGRRASLRLAAGRAAGRFVVAALVYGGAALAYRALSRRNAAPPITGVVGVTVVVALLLWLLCDRIDRLSARLLLGDRADGYQVMRALTQQLAGTLPVDEVAPRVAEAASRTTGRPRAEVRLWLADGERWSRSWPPAAPTVGRGATVGVRHTGSTVGEIVVEDDDTAVDGLSPRDRRLLDDLARPAGPALSTVRLTLELRQRKADLERLTAALGASRERLLQARVVEQRRMRAEVATRVIPYISAALAAVDDDRDQVGDGAFDTAGRAAGRALDELRTIARGIFPPTLSEVGLAASLESWLIRAHVDADLEVPAELPALNAHPDLQACLYFCAVSALALLASHGGSQVQVAVAEEAEPTLGIAAFVGAAVGSDVVDAVTDRVEAFGGTVHSVLSDDRLTLTARVPVPASEPS